MSETPISSLDLISKAQIDPANDIIGLVDKSDTTMSVNGSNKKATIESLVNSVLDNFSWGDIGGDIGDQTDLSLVLAALDAAKLDTTDFNFATISGSAGDNVSLAAALALKVNKAGDTMTGALLSNMTMLTASTPAINLTQTWNNTGNTSTVYNLVGGTVAFASNPSFQNASTWFNFNASGFSDRTAFLRAFIENGHIFVSGQWGDGAISLGTSGVKLTALYGSGLVVTNSASGNTPMFTAGWASRFMNHMGSSGIGAGYSFGTIGGIVADIVCEAANTIGFRNSTNAQRLNIYGTYTDANNYRRFYITSTTGGAFTLGVEGLGTGASGNTLTINNYTGFNNGVGITGALSVNQYDTISDTQVSVELRNGANRATVNTGIAFRPGPTAHYVAYINGVTNSTWNSLIDSSLRFFVAKNNNSTTVSLSHLHQAMSLTAARLNITPEAVTSGSPTGFLFVGPAYTTLDAGVEAADVNWNLSRTVQFSTGALTTQRAFRIQAPTYAFVGASTITNASTLAISGAPIAGTNATITNAYALNIENGALGVGISGSDYGRIIIQDSGQLSSNNAIRVHAGGIYLGQNISVFTVQHNGSVYVRGTLTTDSLGGGVVTHNMSFDGGWGNLTRAVTTPQGNGNRFTNIYGLQIACGNNYGLMVTGSNSNIQLYNTFTDSNNYIRQALSFTTYSSTVHARWAAEGLGTGAVNIPVVITPRGTGAFILGPMPDGTATGGNARGANAVDLQLSRSAATQVASGSGAFTAGVGCTASGSTCVAVGLFSAAIAGNSCFVFGDYATASGEYSFAFGRGTSSAWHSYGFGRGFLSNRSGQFSFANGSFSTGGDAQNTKFVARCTTSGTTPGNLLLGTSWGASATDRISINSGEVFGFLINIIGSKSDGSAVTHYVRKGAIKRVSNTTTLAYVETVGTDYEDNAATDVSITADDTNDALQISVTGIAGETWRWVATVEAVDLGFGT